MEDFLSIDSKLYEKHSLKDLSGKSYDTLFGSIANNLLNKTLLMINGFPYRLLEIEFYLYYDAHKDIYTHKHIDQSTRLKFYFHKQGKTNTYKGGTYKGLDITFGFGNNENNGNILYGGILIRAIQNIADHTEIIGPCNVVNKILELNNVASIEQLINKIPELSVVKESSLYLKKDMNNQLNEKIITVSPRVGLSFGYPEYVMRNYRYLINVATNDKYKGPIIINLYKDPTINKDVKKIAELTSVKISQINKYISQYKESMKTNIDLKQLKPTNSTMIQVMGFYDKDKIDAN